MANVLTGRVRADRVRAIVTRCWGCKGEPRLLGSMSVNKYTANSLGWETHVIRWDMHLQVQRQDR